MAEALTTAELREGIRCIAAKIEACADELNRLDGDLDLEAVFADDLDEQGGESS